MAVEVAERNYLPSLIVCNILSHLDGGDRLRVSSTCKLWRQCLYNKHLWPYRCFTVNVARKTDKFNSKKKNFASYKTFLQRFAHLLETVEFCFDPCSPRQVKNIQDLLQLFKLRSNYDVLRRIAFRPVTIRLPDGGETAYERHCHMMIRLVSSFIDVLSGRNTLESISLGGLENMLDGVPLLLKTLSKSSSKSVKSLTLASVKEDPDYYALHSVSAKLFRPFDNLTSLSIDYDYVCDELVEILADKKVLKELVINVHGPDETHRGVRPSRWSRLSRQCEKLEVTLNLLHADYCPMIRDGLIDVNIPLTRFCSYFTEFNEANVDNIVDMINLIALRHHETLKSLVLATHHHKPWTSLPCDSFLTTGENALIMLAWRCKQLSQLTLFGFEVLQGDLIAIARLRGDQLEQLIVPSCCISILDTYNPDDEGFCDDNRSYLDMAPTSLREQVVVDIAKPLSKIKNWRPLSIDQMPRVVIDFDYSPDLAYIENILGQWQF